MAPDNAPERLAHLPKAVLTAIHAACDGDWRRVTVDDDGGFTVHNAPQFRRVELTPEGDTARRLGMVPAPVRRPRRPKATTAQPAAEVAAPPARSVSAPVRAVVAPAPAVVAPVRAVTPAAAVAPVPAGVPAAVAFLPPAPAPAVAAAPRPVEPVEPVAATDEADRRDEAGRRDEDDVPRHPRYLRARLRALGASVGPTGDDGCAPVFVGDTQVGTVTMTGYRTKQAAQEWRELLARVREHSTH